MKKSFEEALKHRRTYYSITNQSPVSDEEIERIVNLAVTMCSAFNSQSTRVVLLLGENHKETMAYCKETLRKIVPPEVFKTTEAKIDNSFASGYGTVLFFEDQSVVKGLQNAFSSYKDNFRGGRCKRLRCISGGLDNVGRCRFRSFPAIIIITN